MKLFLTIVFSFVILVTGELGKMQLASYEASASLNQIKTNSDSVVERSLIQSNGTSAVSVVQILMLIGLWTFYYTKNKKKTP